MWRPLGKITFFCPNDVFLTIFPLGRSNWLQITKNNFLRFLAFYPLISAFQAFWCIANDRSWRDLSIPIKNSWFHAMWLGIRPFLCSMYESHGLGIENLSKIYRKSIEHLSKIYRKSIENLSKIYRKSVENLSKIYGMVGYFWPLWGHFGVTLGSN